MIRIREKPPLRQHVELNSPKGKRYRWSDDERHPDNMPSGLRHSDTMPGGFESSEVSLPRQPGVDYADLERLSTLRIVGGDHEIDGEYRLERAPRVSGDRVVISPAAAGWQAHLEDDKSVRMIYIDRDLSRWQPMSRARRLNVLNGGTHSPYDFTVATDDGAMPAIVMEFDGEFASTAVPRCEAFYDASPEMTVASVYFEWTRGTNAAGVNWLWQLFNVSTDDPATWSSESQGDQQSEPNATGTGTWTPTTPRRFAGLQFVFNAAAASASPGLKIPLMWRRIAVFADHGLTKRGTAPDQGFYASDIVTHAVRTWAPMLSFTEGADGTVRPSTFVIPQSAFHDPTTAAAIVRDATRFELQDWAVWEGPTFWWHERGAVGRRWRARVAPAQLEETGPQADRLWESVIVQFQDVDGSTRTVGPPGSGADTESADLKDDDAENPANRLIMTRRDLLVMGVGTTRSATEVGRRFLELSKLLDTSGRAVLVGHVQDDRGVLHPYSRVRAGDSISFTDATDTSYRRIVKADKTRESRSCAIDLDSPPEGLQALLEQLGVVLVPLGL